MSLSFYIFHLCPFVHFVVLHGGSGVYLGSVCLSICHHFYAAKYHLGKVKLELMQPASVPIQLLSFRQVKYELMQPAVSAFGST